MRLTVGPLPSAVYWRRRAVVLGAALLFLIVLVYSCTRTGDETGRNGTANPGQSPGPSPVLTPESGGPEPGASESGAPEGDPSDAPAGEELPPVEPAGGGAVPPAAPPVEGGCTDEEMSVVPLASRTTARRGEPIELRLRIKNVSDRTCSRDVGAAMQELFVKSGARKIWSSDVCGNVQTNEVYSFPPTHENEYKIVWNGRESSKCASGLATGPYPAAGSYQLLGRLATKLSEPVKITITN
ncbi:hypothetical protein [Plantactinospora sp. CA-290183]|uniref:hypothetical protein n=1 Tax=Plantactinospora sp. CA-290183 TaxID=3240006 RepID=UPI003D9093C9